MEPNNLDIVVLNNPNGLGLCLTRLLGKDKRVTVDFKDFTPQTKLPFTPTYIIYLMSSFSLEIENILFLQKKYPKSILIPIAQDYDYYEASFLCYHNIFYPLTYNTHVPVLVDFLISISDKSFRPFTLIENYNKQILLSEVQDVLNKYYGSQKVNYKEAAMMYGYFVLHKTASGIARAMSRHTSFVKVLEKRIVDDRDKRGVRLAIDIPRVGDFKLDNCESSEIDIDSGKDEKYLLPQVYDPKKY